MRATEKLKPHAGLDDETRMDSHMKLRKHGACENHAGFKSVKKTKPFACALNPFRGFFQKLA